MSNVYSFAVHGQFSTSDLSMSDVCYSINCSSSSNIGEAALHVIPRDKGLNTFSYHYLQKGGLQIAKYFNRGH